MESESDYVDRTDGLLRNMPASEAYETCIGVVPEPAHITSIIWVAREDTWMMCVIEELQRRLKGVRRGGREPYVLKTRYNDLLPVSTTERQAEALTCLLRALPTAADDSVQLKNELTVDYAARQVNV